jgi:chromosome segregation ATPase
MTDGDSNNKPSVEDVRGALANFSLPESDWTPEQYENLLMQFTILYEEKERMDVEKREFGLKQQTVDAVLLKLKNQIEALQTDKIELGLQLKHANNEALELRSEISRLTMEVLTSEQKIQVLRLQSSNMTEENERLKRELEQIGQRELKKALLSDPAIPVTLPEFKNTSLTDNIQLAPSWWSKVTQSRK